MQYGAQNFYYEEAGALQEVSLNMLSSLGCLDIYRYSKRQILSETDDLVNVSSDTA